MAGRNQKENADYFPHDADASSDEKIIYLESKFGHTGYALYFKFLERMTRAATFKLEWNEIKKSIYASEFGISVTEIDLFVTECCRKEINAFLIEDGYIFSCGLIKRFSGLIAKREYNRQKYEQQKQEVINSVTEKPISVIGNTQQRKEKKRKEYIYTHLESYLKSKIQNGLMPYSEKIIEFFLYRQKNFPKAKKYKTEKGIDGLIRDITGCQKAGLSITDCLDIAMEKNWLTPAPSYFNNLSIPKQQTPTPKVKYLD